MDGLSAMPRRPSRGTGEADRRPFPHTEVRAVSGENENTNGQAEKSLAEKINAALEAAQKVVAGMNEAVRAKRAEAATPESERPRHAHAGTSRREAAGASP